MFRNTIQDMKDMEKQLKQAIKKSKISRYRIAKESGLTESQLSYFVNGHRTLTLPAAAKLAKVLGLELVQKKRRNKKWAKQVTLRKGKNQRFLGWR